MGVVCGILDLRPLQSTDTSDRNNKKMAGETVVETPQDNTKVDEPVKTDKEVIAEEEAAQANEEKKEKKEKEEAKKPAAAEKAKKPLSHVKDFEDEMVYLFQYTRSPQIPSISPFCLKLESWLKLHGVKYQNVDHKCKFRSKKGMLPFIEMNGEEIADSNIIIDTLSKKFEKEMPAQLTQDQKNVQHAMIAMVENHLHWTVVYWKSKDVDNILKGYKLNLQSAIGSKAPASLLNFYFKYTFCRKGMKKVRSNGMGVHTAEEIENFGKKDLQTLSEMLGDKEFFFGEEPAMLDLVVFSHVAQLAMVDKEYACPLRDYLESDCNNLVGLVNRMKDRCWGDHWVNATGEEMDLNPHMPKPEPPAPEPEKEEEQKEEEKVEEKKEETAEKEEKKEEEKEKAEEKKEEKEKVNMLTKMANAFNKLKPQSAAPAAAAADAEKADDKAEAESKPESSEEKKEEPVEEKKEEENKEKEEKSEEKQ